MEKFLVGSSTSAHQVEGNNIHSDYWAMEHMTYTDFVEPSGCAIDHYNHYEQDIKLMKEAGLNAYRFSIEWARIEPECGVFSTEEMKHYIDVIDTCIKYEIEPIVTLFHFTSPKWLISLGGWENKKVVDYFCRYTEYVVSNIKDKVHYICTINEANMGIQVAAIAKRYKMQMMNKMKNKKKDDSDGKVQVGINLSSMLSKMRKKKEENKEVFNVRNPQVFVSMRSKKGDKYVCLCHAKARDIIKSINPNINVGITLSLHDIQSIQGGEKRSVKEWNDEFTHYIKYIQDDDFFGLQNYSRSLIGKFGQVDNPEGSRLTQMGYEFYPEGLGHVIKKVYNELHIPIMITENGIATDDDNERIEYIQKAVEGLDDARKEVPVLGYMHWSFADNFEWQKGFSMRFGLVAVNRTTMERIPKASLYWLGNYCKSINGTVKNSVGV